MSSSIDWQTLSVQLIMTFAHFLWQGALIGGVLFCLLRLCCSQTANTRYIISSIALALLPVCVGVTFVVVHLAGEPIFVALNSPSSEVSTVVAAPDVAFPFSESQTYPSFRLGELPTYLVACKLSARWELMMH